MQNSWFFMILCALLGGVNTRVALGDIAPGANFGQLIVNLIACAKKQVSQLCWYYFSHAEKLSNEARL